MSTVIEIFPWNEVFSTGIEKVDAQHRILVGLLNELVSHLTYGTEVSGVDSVFNRLARYAVEHFASEQELWDSTFGDDVWSSGHRTIHTSFVSQVLEMKANATAKPTDEVIDTIITFLMHWLALHIIDTDKRMALAVLAIQSGATLAKAKERADAAMAGSARPVIETVMAMYDSLAGRTVQLAREVGRRTETERKLKTALAELEDARASMAVIDELKASQHALHERSKEQRCLYDMATLTDNLDRPVAEVFDQVVASVCEAWQFPGITVARVEFPAGRAQSDGFIETTWQLVSETSPGTPYHIRMTVAYLEERPQEYEGPFFREERELLDQIVRRLSQFLERRDVRQTLERRERILDTLFRYSSDAITIVDPVSAQFVEFNTEAYRGLGYTQEEFGHLRVMEIQAEQDEHEIGGVIARVMAGEQVQFESRHRTKDGRLVDVALNMRLIAAGDTAVIATVWKDITERKNRELREARYREQLENLVAIRTAELESRNAELQTLVESVGVGVAMLDNRVVQRCNTKLTEIFGYTEEEMLGASTRLWYPDDVSYRIVGEKVAAMISDGVDFKHELPMVRKDGRLFWARIGGRPLRTGSRDGNLIVATVEDMSEERAVAEELMKAKIMAEDANLAKSTFLATMSHEIRTPLNAVIGLSYLVMKTDLTSRQRDYLNKIEYSSQHLLSLINDILDFSKIEAGQMELEEADFVLEDILQALADFLAVRTAGKPVETLFDIEPDVPHFLRGDRLRIQQVLFNFCSNAAKFTAQGEIRTVISVESRSEATIQLRFAVSDTGIGISAEQMTTLWKSFKQADMSTTRKYGGSGLGLAISQRLVDLMHGQAGADSEPGKGSTFWFSVPLSHATNRAPILKPHPDLRGFRALVMDGNESARAVLVSMLRTISFDVTEAGDARELTHLLVDAEARAMPFKVIFLAYSETDTGGIMAARTVRALDLRQSPLIILTPAAQSVYGLGDDDRALLSAVVSKPITPSTLFDTVMNLVGKSDAAAMRRPSSVDAGSAVSRIGEFAGARVLLVEDNELNREVARGLLDEAGITVDEACDGQEAVDKAQGVPCDLILMDLQMPVMDGLEATRRIRANPAMAGIPIIAMTANATTSDRVMCIDAGMNDFIPKPIEPRLLWQTLLCWMPPAQKRSASTSSTPGHQQTVRAATSTDDAGAGRDGAAKVPRMPSVPGFDLDSGLARVLGKQDAYRSMLERFHSSHAGDCAAAAAALSEGDREGARRQIHTLKGVAGTVGAVDIQADAAAVEKILRDGGSGARLDEAMASLAITLDNGMQALGKVLGTETVGLAGQTGRYDPDTATAIPANPEDMAALAELSRLLHSDDAAALKCLKGQHDAIARVLGSHFPAMEEAVLNFDFSGALTYIDQPEKG